MRDGKKRLIKLAILATGIGAWTAFGGSAAVAQENAKELAERIEASRKGVAEAEVQKRRILGSLYGINQRMKKITKEKSHLTDELFQVQDNVKNIAKLIAQLEAQIGEQRVHLRRRLRTLYKLSGEGYVAILFSRSSAADLDETLRFLKIVTDQDYRLIKSYQSNIRTYEQQRKKLRGQVERLVGIEKTIKKQESLLAQEHKAKSKIVSELDKDRTQNIQKLRTLRTKTKTIVKSDGINWAELLKPSIFEQKGQLAPPVRGRVVHDFGLITDEKYKTRLSHKGWRMAAARGTPVSSIFDGTVVHADWIEGYGQTVIVDHGDHYYSVYSHISRLKAKSGDTLKKGQVFAETGPGARGQADGLYFEIRHFSEPENPASWISKKALENDTNAAEKLYGARGADNLEESLKQ